ncbi:hypothetical protein PoB_004452200 [Plakobranchus ocellatus]|uniref:Uncharacterized protein n=1 Tax=Plakobranchus ocellatus TaxID=259542 RepID=A0AAV4BGD0_9GAST|nr:hypothetical protein PoB_004452200 [Plakobranchus ocellatus]
MRHYNTEMEKEMLSWSVEEDNRACLERHHPPGTSTRQHGNHGKSCRALSSIHLASLVLGVTDRVKRRRRVASACPEKWDPSRDPLLLIKGIYLKFGVYNSCVEKSQSCSGHVSVEKRKGGHTSEYVVTVLCVWTFL